MSFTDIQKAFNKRDADGDGYLNETEFYKALKMLNIRPTDEEKRSINDDLVAIDPTKTKIDIATLTFVVSFYLRGKDSKEDLVRAFSVFDPEGTQCLKTEQCIQILTSIKHPLTEERAKEIVLPLDPENQGEVSIVDLVNALFPEKSKKKGRKAH